MCSDNFVLHVTNHTNICVVQHGKNNLKILKDDIRIFIAVLSASRYCKSKSIPYRNLCWTDAPGTHIEAVSCAMSRNKFRELLSNLHLAGNTQIDTEDRYCKVQVLFEKLDLSFK